VGGLIGAGIAYAFLPNWSAFIEYNYMDFGHRTATIKTTDITDPGFDTATFNWQFNWGKAPIVARY
jgi:outer membrane immunogenic protein